MFFSIIVVIYLACENAPYQHHFYCNYHIPLRIIAVLFSHKQNSSRSQSWEAKMSQLFKMAELRKFQTGHKQATFNFTFSDTNNFLCFLVLISFVVISQTIRLTFCHSGGSTEHKSNRLLKHADLCHASSHAVMLFFSFT